MLVSTGATKHENAGVRLAKELDRYLVPRA